MDVFTLWLDHGVKPQDASYEYIVVPGAEKSKMEEYSRNSPIEILENSTDIQAAHHRDLQRTHIVFYRPARIKVHDITLSASSPCIVMIKGNGKTIEQLVVSDPTHKLPAIRLSTSALIEGSGEHWKALWNRKEKASILDIDLPRDEYAGQSIVLTLPVSQ
jgi:chondroitin AC lyase